MCANSEGSGETARMRRLAWVFAGRLCDKYHNLMSWLKCAFILIYKASNCLCRKDSEAYITGIDPYDTRIYKIACIDDNSQQKVQQFTI